MRRAEKEIKDKEEIIRIIKDAEVCRIALMDGQRPYILPMNFGYRGNCIYLHCAKEGRKLDIIKKNNNICFEIEEGVELITNKSACNYSMKFKSIIGFGKGYIIQDNIEKKEALTSIIEKFTTGYTEITSRMINSVEIIKIEIDEVYGKKSGY